MAGERGRRQSRSYAFQMSMAPPHAGSMGPRSSCAQVSEEAWDLRDGKLCEIVREGVQAQPRPAMMAPKFLVGMAGQVKAPRDERALVGNSRQAK
jgi:hypothetical protein